jgi:hypothetical protein
VRRVEPLAALAAALALATALRLPAAWESGNALNHVSGVWLALADDLARGTLYRPVHGDAGFGGTRYFPLVFALEAGLLRAGVPLVAAGYAASLAAGVALAAGAFLLLRALGLGGRAAATFAPLALAGFAGQHALASARGDLLPVALSALGLAAVARGRVPHAALALALAFAAKPTALTATAAAVAWLALRRARGRAAALAAATALLAGLAIALTEALSGGRFLAGMSAVGGAGAGLATAIRAPIRLAEELAIEDPYGLVLALAGGVALAASLRPLARAARTGDPDPRLLPALWLVVAWAGALAVLAVPGTGVNHLVELEAASAIFLGVQASSGPARRIARGGAAAAAVAGLAVAVAVWRGDRASSRLADAREVLRALPPGEVFSEDPLVPLLAGASPRMLDPFTIRITAEREPGIVAPLVAGLRDGAFAAVVLLHDLDAPGADAWYADANLGAALAAAIRRGYARAATTGRYHLYLPRAGGGGVVRRDELR